MSEGAMNEDEDGGEGVRSPAEETVLVVSVGSVRYAVGLFWNEVDDPAKAAEEARRIAARPEMDYDLFCLRAKGDQYGLGRKSDGLTKSMPALAGHLADSRSGSWLGIFALEGGFYLISVHDDQITADAFYGDETEARARFDEAYGIQEWGAVFCPVGYDIPDSKECAVGEVFSAKPPRLRDVNRVGGALKLVAFGVVALAILGGSALYWQGMQAAEEAAEMARMQAEAIKNAAGASPAKVALPDPPWTNKFKGVDFIRGCEDAMKRAVLDIPGWRSTRLSCDGQAAEVVMTVVRQGELGKGGGTINWVRWALDNAGMREAVANPSAASSDIVDVRWRFDKEPERWQPEVGGTPTMRDMRRYLQSQLEEMFVSATFRGLSAPPPAPAKDVPLPPVEFRELSFRFDTSFEPSAFSAIFARIPGFMVSKVDLDLVKLSYSIEAKVNEQIVNQPPARKGGPVQGAAAFTPPAQGQVNVQNPIR